MSIDTYPPRDIIAQPLAVSARLSRRTAGSQPTGGVFVTFDTVDFDTDGMVTPGDLTKLTIRTPGKYLVQGGFRFAAVSGGTERTVYINRNRNGVTDIIAETGSPQWAALARVASEDPSTTVDLQVGDIITLNTYHDQGGMVAVQQGERNFLAVTLLSGNANGVPSGARVERRTALTHASSANWVAVPFDTSVSDTDAMWNNLTPTRLYARQTGWYVVSGRLEFGASGAGLYRLAAIWKNGAAPTDYNNHLSQSDGVLSANASSRINVNTIVYLRAGEYLELMGYQNTGGNLAYEVNEPLVFSMVCLTGTTVSTREAPGASLFRATSTAALAATTWVPIPLAAAEWDDDNMFDSVAGRLVCRTPGTYVVDAMLQFSGNASNWRRLAIVKNGAVNPVTGTYEAHSSTDVDSATDSPNLMAHGIVKLRAGDVLEVWGYVYGIATVTVDRALLRAVLQKPMSQQALYTPERWRVVGSVGEVPFQNNWNHYLGDPNNADWGAVSYRKLPTGEVCMKGLIAGGSNGQAAFTFPLGYRPKKHVTFTVWSSHASQFTVVQVNPDGLMTPNIINAHNGYVGELSVVRFFTD